MEYKGVKIMITSGDIAATSAAGAAISMPWWLAAMPEIFAIAAAPIGFAIVVLTVAIKYNEYKLSKLRLQEEQEEACDVQVRGTLDQEPR